MLTPTPLMKRLAVCGKLVPFFKCVCLYFVAASDAAPSTTAMAAKCAPVVCLMLFVMLHRPPDYTREQEWYARRIAVGLAMSAVGDAMLVWPEYFVAGMAAFAAAHVAYICAFRFQPLALHIAVTCHVAAALFVQLLTPPGPLAALVPAYALLLASMAWRGAARGGRAGRGALLFLASDAVLAYGMFAGPVPYKQLLVMSTYYLGQMSIALSVLEPFPA